MADREERSGMIRAENFLLCMGDSFSSKSASIHDGRVTPRAIRMIAYLRGSLSADNDVAPLKGYPCAMRVNERVPDATLEDSVARLRPQP
jgi:hypothetical protein